MAHRNWTTIGIGLEILAGVIVAVEPLLALPVAFCGGIAIAYGLFPTKFHNVVARLTGRQSISSVETINKDQKVPKLVVLHEKVRDTEPWPDKGGYTVRFRVLNDSSARATAIGARIRTLKFLENGAWRSYQHDYTEVPLAAARGGEAKFDLQSGDECPIYIARRPTRPGDGIQLCYAKDGFPDTIPLKPAWRIGVRLVSDNTPSKDAEFQLRVSSDESLVGILLDEEAADELTRRKRRAEYISGIYEEAVKLRNRAASLRVLDAATEVKIDELQEQLVQEIRDLAPEKAINLGTLNQYDPGQLPPTCLQDPKRTLEFSELLRRVMKILEDYK